MKGEYISIETSKIMADIEKENKELHEIIEKAIKYIEQGIWSNGIDEEKQYSLHIPTLLEILKGVN
jgi:hypothetical protein